MTKNPQTIDSAIALERIADLKDDVKTLTIKVKDEYVTFTRYNPVEKIVYGAVGLILMSILGAGIAFLLGKR